MSSHTHISNNNEFIEHVKRTAVYLDLPEATSYKDAGQLLLEKSNVADLQLSSFDKFINEVVPYYLNQTYNCIGGLASYRFIDWRLDYSNTNTEDYCRNNKTSYIVDLYATIEITYRYADSSTGEFTLTEEILLEKVPLLTKNGCVIINGQDRTLVSHLESVNSIILEEIEKSDVTYTVLKLKSSLRSLKDSKNLDKSATSARSMHIETNGKNITFKLDGLRSPSKTNKGKYSSHSIIKLLEENKALVSTYDIQKIVGDSPQMRAEISNYKTLDYSKHSSGAETSNLLTALSNFQLKVGERNALTTRTSLTRRALGLQSFEDIIDPTNPDNILCHKGEVLSNTVLDKLQSCGKDVTVISVVDGVSGVQIINNRFALSNDVINNTKMLDYIPSKIKDKFISYTVLEELINISETESIPIEDLIDVNYNRLIGTSLNFDDFVSIINLYGQLLSKEIEPEDSTSLETKSLISIAEIYEEQFMKKFIIENSSGNTISNWIHKLFSAGSATSLNDFPKEMQVLERLDIKGSKGLPFSKSIIKIIASHKLFNSEDTTSPISSVSMKRKFSQQSVEGRGGVPNESSNVKIRTVHSSFRGRVDLQETSEGTNVGLVRFLSALAKVNSDGMILAAFFWVDKVNRKIDYNKVIYLPYSDEKRFTIAIPEVANRSEVVIDIIKRTKYKNEILERVNYPIHYTEQGELLETVNFDNIAKDLIKQKYSEVEGGDIDYIIKYYKKDWFKDENRIQVFKGTGEVTTVDYTEVDFVSTVPYHLASLATAATPFNQFNDSARIMMGNNHGKQAISLLNPEEPVIVSKVSGEIAKKTLGSVFAPESGEVEKVEADRIIIRPFKAKNELIDISLIRYFETSVNTRLFSIPIVKPGDIVLEGDQIAMNNMTSKNGQIRHGVGLVIAIMAMDGKNFEDSIILSERVLKDELFTSLHLTEYRFEINPRDLFYPITSGSNSKSKGIPKEVPFDWDLGGILNNEGRELSKEYSRIINRENGLIFPDTVIEPNDPILITHKLDSKVMTLGSETSYHLKTYTYDGHTSGRVVHSRVEKNGEIYTFVIQIESKESINPGDKISGRHGNKGIVSTILREEDMPFDQETGQRVDIVFNPLGIPSRMNLGQLMETHLAPILKSLGLRVELTPNETIDMDIFKQLITFKKDKQGFPTAKSQLIDGRTGEPFEGLTTLGLGYFLKAKHLVDHKFAVRSTGYYDAKYGQPPQGKKSEGGQKIGTMELWSLTEHAALNVIWELLKLKSDDPASREALSKYLDLKRNEFVTGETGGGRAEDILEKVTDLVNTPHTQKLVNALYMGAYIYPKHLTENNEELNPFADTFTINLTGKGRDGNLWVKSHSNGVKEVRENVCRGIEKAIPSINGHKRVISQENTNSHILGDDSGPSIDLSFL